MNPSIIYRDFKPALTAVCGRLINDPRDREELVNDSFMRIFQKYDTYDPAKATLYTWMRKITLNTAISFVRQRSLACREMTEAFEQAVQPASNYNVEEHLFCLMPATANIFRLYVIEGYSHKEIGEINGISEGTSRWHLSEARKKLRSIIIK